MPPKPESSLSDPSQSWKTRSSSGTGKSDFLGFSQQEDYLLEKVTASDYGLWLVIIIYSYKHIDMFISWHLFIYRDTLDYILYTDSCMGHSPFWFSKPRFTCSFKSFPTYRHHYACIYIGSFFFVSGGWSCSGLHPKPNWVFRCLVEVLSPSLKLINAYCCAISI